MRSAAQEGRQAMAEDTLDVADQAVLSYQKELIFSQGTEGTPSYRRCGWRWGACARARSATACTAARRSAKSASKRCHGPRTASRARRRSRPGRSRTWCARPNAQVPPGACRLDLFCKRMRAQSCAFAEACPGTGPPKEHQENRWTTRPVTR